MQLWLENILSPARCNSIISPLQRTLCDRYDIFVSSNDPTRYEGT